MCLGRTDDAPKLYIQLLFQGFENSIINSLVNLYPTSLHLYVCTKVKNIALPNIIIKAILSLTLKGPKNKCSQSGFCVER